VRRERIGDAACVVLAAVAVADVVQLGLEPLPVVVGAQLLLWALLLLRHLSPTLLLLVPVVPVLLGVVAPGTNDDTVTQAAAAYLFAYWAGRLGGPRLQLSAGVLVLASTLAIELQQWPLDRTDVSDVVYLSAPMLLALGVGARLARRRREQAELHELRHRLDAELAEQAQRVLDEERQRIGQELHDVVAQGAGAVVAQATAARLLLESGRADDTATALSEVEDAARDALSDMRRLLGVLREDVPADEPVGAP
jgi:signal transduction histidine kinase